MLRRLVVFIFFLGSIPLFVKGQTNIQGKLIDQETGEVLPGAHIYTHGKLVQTTSTDGTFHLKSPDSDVLELRITFLGYKDLELFLNASQDTSLILEMEEKVYISDEIIVRSGRVSVNNPVVHSNLPKKEIERRNIGQDLPYILNHTPSVVVTSDAGNGIGYTGLRLRGTDITGINISLNGLPVNDPESGAVFFVDLPDLASSLNSVQIQRGVGSSAQGGYSFGANINLETDLLQTKPHSSLNSAAGSFNSFKNTFRFGSGKINNNWSFDGRLSQISSDGYIDRAWSKLTSVFVSGGYYAPKTMIKAVILGGWEQTYQAWNGTPKDSLANNRRYNPSGAIFNDEGEIIDYYDNETDNYQQNYYQLHWAQDISDTWLLSTSIFYTRGLGYFENYRNDDSFSSYGLENIMIGQDTIFTTDLVRQKWLDNHYYGAQTALQFQSDRMNGSMGTGYYAYDGGHYGYITWAEFASNNFPGKKWYDNTGKKRDWQAFAKTSYILSEKLALFGDVQIRAISYQMEGIHDDLSDLTQSHDYFFFNPKIGINYGLSREQRIYASVGISNREPNRSVFRDADPDQEIFPEQLQNIELGYQFNSSFLSIQLNYFYMNYKNQFVHTGKINNVGAPIMTNVPSSFRQGIETSFSLTANSWFGWQWNLTLSQNKIRDFTAYVDNWDYWSDPTMQAIQLESYLGTTNISFSPEIIANNFLTFRPCENLQIELISQYVGRQYIDNTSSLNRSLDPYFIQNIRFSHEIPSNLFRQIRLQLDLNNVFNEEYETYGWVYRFVSGGTEGELNGYFSQATFNFMFGLEIGF